MLIKQISVFVENRAGRLAEITEIIATNNINIRALSIADTTNFGILRIIVDEPYEVERILKENSLTVSVTDVISVNVEDKAGELAKILRILADKNIAIEYMYDISYRFRNEYSDMTIINHNGKVIYPAERYVVFKIEKEKESEAVEVLKNAGYE